MTMDQPVLVLGGGPDAEREISITSAAAVHEAAIRAGVEAELLIVDRPSALEVESWRGRAVVPVLHGPFGEGGGLQRMLEAAGLRFVGSRAGPARLAMDKMATKLAAARAGVPVSPASIIGPGDSVSPVGLPAVIKPVADGSSFGLHLCRDEASWSNAIGAVDADRAANPDRVYMAEPLVSGRELTAPLLGRPDGSLRVLPLVEIAPESGVYDFDAKYERQDTRYTVSPDLAEGMNERIADLAERVGRAIGVRHLARVDFILPELGDPVLLELNTMPGFTPNSLLPMAARSEGMDMPALVRHLVELVQTD
ncbi:MAG: ATP-grasp domain-containing protein [Planctomycetota bacterium]